MVYNREMSIKDLKEQYDLIIGWGTGIQFRTYYHKEYQLDYLIDGLDKNLGTIVCGMKVESVNILETLTNKKICIVIFCNSEREIGKQLAQKGYTNIDLINYNLVALISYPPVYGKNAEDIIMLNLIRKLGMNDLTYMDIGVCHPIHRNNTYLFHKHGFQGVLVEPNPDFAELIEFYRPQDKLLRCGAAYGDNSVLKYYSFPSSPGLNTFSENLAVNRNKEYEVMEIPVININELIQDNFNTYPGILDLDAEGFDYQLVEALDLEQFKIEVICCETSGRERFNQLFETKGYKSYAVTVENTIYVRNDLNIKFM